MKIVSVRSQLEATHGAVHQFRVAHLAEVRLCVGGHRSFLPTLQLVLEHADERILGSDSVRKRSRLQRPGMPLAPEAVHERVHVLHIGVPVVGIRQQVHQFAKRALKRWRVVARLIPRTLQPVAQLDHRNLVAQKLRQRRIRNIWIAEHHAKANPLPIFPRQLKRQLPVLAEIESACPLLHILPVHAQIKLRAQRQLHQILNRLRQCLAVFASRSNFVADVGDQPHPIVRHHLARRSQRHHHVPAGIIVGGERPLIEPVDHRRPGPKVVLVKVVRWNVRQQRPRAQSRSQHGSASLQKRSSLHFEPSRAAQRERKA